MNKGQVLSDFTDIIVELLGEVNRLNKAVVNLSKRVDALESSRRQRSEVGERVYAVQWLEAYLTTNGVSRPADIVMAGEKESISRSTVYRARKLLGARISDTHGRQDPANCWELIDSL